MHSRAVALAVFVFVALAPHALATWYGKGTWEPDTRMDDEQGWMHLEPDTDPRASVRLVYFNGFHNEISGNTWSSYNPNVGTAQTAVFTGAQYSFLAMLGVWKDCNNDGYVGIGETGQWEYRAEVLGATYGTSICAPEATPYVPQTGRPPLDWFPSHNDGSWVREFLSISWRDWNHALGDENPWDINDNGSRVWADYGAPGVFEELAFTCVTRTEGVMHTTGAMLEEVDCLDGRRTTPVLNALLDSNAITRPYSFSDHPTDERNSDSEANIENPWGDESDSSMVQPWSCGTPLAQARDPTAPPGESGALHDVTIVAADTEVISRNLTTSDGYLWFDSPVTTINDQAFYANVSNPRVPPGTNTGGSPAGTANATASGFDKCDRRSEAAGNSRTLANAPYLIEGDTPQNPPKSEPSATLLPRVPLRPSAPYQLVLGKSGPPGPGANFEMEDLGMGVTSASGFWRDEYWRADAPVLSSRLDVQTTWYRTFYGFVSPTAVSAYGLTLPKGSATADYGFEACGSDRAGERNGWQCDPDLWWRNGDGTSNQYGAPMLGPGTCNDAFGTDGVCIGARMAQPYNLRDVDCSDDNVGATRDLDVGPEVVFGVYCERA